MRDVRSALDTLVVEERLPPGDVLVTLALQLQLIGWNATQPGSRWTEDHLHGFRFVDAHFDELC